MSDNIRPGPYAVPSQVTNVREALKMARERARYHEEEHPRLSLTEHIVDWIDRAEELLPPMAEKLTREEQKHHVFMNVALEIGGLGTCDRKRVGAVIVRDGRCISWGFNGAPPGLPHCDENFHGYLSKGFKTETFMHSAAEEKLALEGCANATHAEANALAFAARQGISTDNAELFVTVSPCENCARLIIAAGIIRVYYLEAYRKDDGCQILQNASIQAVQL